MLLSLLLSGAILPAAGQSNRWIEATTTHFNIYSEATVLDVYKLAARLEQFSKSYSMLAGTQAVASPPIVVLAFSNHTAMEPFLPLYQGQPANLSGFFARGSDENLIVLSVADRNGMSVIFHEYAHLLFRRNDQIWPLWLKEGMAEIYSTFATTGGGVVIAQPIDHHLAVLARDRWMPLAELFAVKHDSPQYNERDRQGIFYAESWLLAQYLAAGDNAAYRARFGNYTLLLMNGQTAEQAFTNAMGVPLSVMENDLHRYFARGKFYPIGLSLGPEISAPVMVATRWATPEEVDCRLGDELVRVDRADAAAVYFNDARKVAPTSPLPYEGLGLLASQRDQHAEAVRQLKEALRLGSTNFLAHFLYARERLRLTADAQDRYTRVGETDAAEIRGELQKSIALMPDFGQAHEVLGFFDMVQGDLSAAERQLRRAIQLEPENPSYLLTLAQDELAEKDYAGMRQTLQPLLLPVAEADLRVHAEDLLKKIKERE